MKPRHSSPIRFISYLLVVVFVLAALAVPGHVAAAGVVGNGSPASCTEAAFRAAVAGGGAVTFNCGGAAHTIPITSSIEIRSDTSIDGGGLINISGGETNPTITIVSATVNMSNLTVRDTGAVDFSIGTTIRNNGTLNVTGVTFVNNNFISLSNGSSLSKLTIKGSRFEDNTSSGYAGAVINQGGATLDISDSVFVNNRVNNAGGFAGGAVFVASGAGTATISRSVFSGNSAYTGGAISSFGAVTISDSLFTGNTATFGGALEARSAGSMTVSNSTISGNTASRSGGGIYGYVGGGTPANTATLTNVTLAGNTGPADASSQGGGNVAVDGNGGITLRNSIVASPGSPGANCSKLTATATITNGGGNLQFPGTTCDAAISSAEPKLGALADNGGPSATHALASDSPAREAANAANCAANDQRGVVRPQNGGCDIGAFEYGAVPVLSGIQTPCGRIDQTFTLIVSGSNFISGAKGSQIVLNGAALQTSFVSPTELRAEVRAGTLIGEPGSTVPVAVQTPVVDGGASAGQLSLTLCVVRLTYMPIAEK